MFNPLKGQVAFERLQHCVFPKLVVLVQLSLDLSLENEPVELGLVEHDVLLNNSHERGCFLDEGTFFE